MRTLFQQQEKTSSNQNKNEENFEKTLESELKKKQKIFKILNKQNDQDFFRF